MLPNYEKPVILGLPFIQQYHEDLNFKEKTLAGIQSCSSLDLIDANTFLREMNTGQIGMFLVKMDSTSEEADVGGKIGDKDIVDEVQGDNKGVFQELLREYVDIFKNELDEAPPHRGNWDPKIEVIPYATPPASRQYPLSQPEAAELKAQVLKMLKAGLISLSPVQLSNYNAPVLFVKKSDGSFRLCIDFRLLNLTVVQKAFNMPVADLLVREVAGYRYYSTLDMVSAFHQLHLEELSKRYTVFTAFGRRYSFNVLPFGYTNAPAHLSEVVSELVADIDGCTNFVDDIIVYSNSLLEHKEILRKLFEKFRVHHFWFKPAKCFFGNSSATFLGHEVNKAGVTIPDDHLATIRNLVFPPTPKGMRKALGFFNFFRAYVKNYAAVTHVLYKFAAALVNRTQLIRTYIKDTLSRYQDDMEKKANKGRKGKKYKLGEWILLHRDAYYTLVKYKKLTPVYYGPFKIVKVINENAYELDLPTMVKKDRVINSKYFRKYLLDEVAFRDVPRPGKESEVRAAEVSAILGLDLENKMLDVTWLGCRPNHCTRVLLDWFNKFVPVHLRRALFENAKTLFSDRIADTSNTDESLV